MSRLKKFAYALLSGYALMGTNIVFTLLSVPLALHYLKSNEKFGLWALTTQIAGYIALIDLGMSGISRILIDYKDRKDSSDYGNIIQTVWLVSVVQAMVIVVRIYAAHDRAMRIAGRQLCHPPFRLFTGGASTL